MENSFSDVRIEKLPRMKVAMHKIISSEPENEVFEYMDNWAKESGLLDYKDYNSRKFGWNYPHLSEEEKSKNFRGYEYCYTLPENFIPKNDGVKILFIESDEYAVLRITDPFSNPFEKIPPAWEKLMDYVNNSEYKTTRWDNRYTMEEVIEINGITYMDIYIPVK
jgi:DNA gyrase inhibitor GyrI